MTKPCCQQEKSLTALLRIVSSRLDESGVGADIADDLDRISREIRDRGLDELSSQDQTDQE